MILFPKLCIYKSWNRCCVRIKCIYSIAYKTIVKYSISLFHCACVRVSIKWFDDVNLITPRPVTHTQSVVKCFKLQGYKLLPIQLIYNCSILWNRHTSPQNCWNIIPLFHLEACFWILNIVALLNNNHKYQICQQKKSKSRVRLVVFLEAMEDVMYHIYRKWCNVYDVY